LLAIFVEGWPTSFRAGNPKKAAMNRRLRRRGGMPRLAQDLERQRLLPIT
jgi:hypothetical protein